MCRICYLNKILIFKLQKNKKARVIVNKNTKKQWKKELQIIISITLNLVFFPFNIKNTK